MSSFTRKKLAIFGFAVIMFLAIPLTIFTLQRPQDTRSRASGSAKLNFIPTSSTTAPLQKNVGETIPLDIMVDPGTHAVTFVRFQVKYDPTKLEVSSSDPFTLNQAAFPSKIEGPVVGSGGTVAESVSVGSDPTKAITKVTKVGTLNFKAIGPTGNTPTTITYTTITQVLSSGTNDQAAENVLSTTATASIIVTGNALTPTVTGTASITPGGPTVTKGPTVTPAPTANTTILKFNLLLHGVGAAGDNPNPAGNSLSNKNPLHPQRNIKVEIYGTDNQLATSASGSLLYNAGSGAFTGTVDLGPSFQEGSYSLKVKTDRYLRKLVPGIQTIKNLAENDVQQTDLVAGDVNSDNLLNILDYNALLDCGYGELNPLPMEDANSLFNSTPCQNHIPAVNVDIEDNGIINSADYNLFLRELSVQNGD